MLSMLDTGIQKSTHVQNIQERDRSFVSDL